MVRAQKSSSARRYKEWRPERVVSHEIIATRMGTLKKVSIDIMKVD